MASLRSKVMRLGSKAVERMMQNDRAVAAVASTLGRAQRGKQALDKLQDGLLHSMGFAARGDYKALGKRVSAMKRKVRELCAQVDALG